MSEIDWLKKPAKTIEQHYLRQAEARQNTLTKPPGSLGRLEGVATALSAMQQTIAPSVETVYIAVFAADHGIAEENVSAFPQAVTLEMVRNFARGGAAISVLAQQLGARLEVINLGTVAEQEALKGVLDKRIAPGTQNFSRAPAMSPSQMAQALDTGRQTASNAQAGGADLFIAGDMGIANTTSATALACALLNKNADTIAGPGTGLDEAGVQHKAEVIDRSIALHRSALRSPEDILQHLGGFEIAAMVAAYIACAQQGLPVLVDGFISSVAALLAVKINPGCQHWMFFSHESAEPGHKIILQSLRAEPLLQINMRLGEASGAATVVPLMRLACALQNNMATFDEAGVSDKD